MNSERWGRISEIFGDALDREVANREAFVEQACGGDAELCQEILDLLARNDRSGAFVDSLCKVGACQGDAINYARADFSRFSTRGTKGWDGNDYFALKPGRWPLVDILAPGTKFWGAASSVYDPKLVQAKGVDSRGNANAARLKGTSQATPLVTAAVAYLCASGDWKSATAAQIRSAIRRCTDSTNIPSLRHQRRRLA